LIQVKTSASFRFIMCNMLGLSRKNRFRTAQTLLTLLGSLWLLAAAAPCVMAAPHCPPGMAGDCQSMDQQGLSVAGDCDALTAVDCQSADEVQLAATTPVMDFSVVPVRLHGLPAAAALHTPHAPDRYATVILSPPLNLQHAVLLI
jgi:hypothetical protein